MDISWLNVLANASCQLQSYCAGVRDHAERVINKWRAIIDGNLSKEGKPAPVPAAGGQKRPPTGGAGDASAVTTHAAKADGPPAKKTAPVKTAPSQFRDTGTLNAAYSLPCNTPPRVASFVPISYKYLGLFILILLIFVPTLSSLFSNTCVILVYHSCKMYTVLNCMFA